MAFNLLIIVAGIGKTESWFIMVATRIEFMIISFDDCDRKL